MLTRRRQKALEATPTAEAPTSPGSDNSEEVDVARPSPKKRKTQVPETRKANKELSEGQPDRSAHKKPPIRRSVKPKSGIAVKSVRPGGSAPAQRFSKPAVETSDLEIEADDDSDAPEEVSLAVSKEAAELRTQQERKRKLKTANQRLRRTQQKLPSLDTESQEAQEEKKQAGTAVGGRSETAVAEQQGRSLQESAEDVLPASVIAALQEQSRNKREIAKAADVEQPRLKQKKRQRQLERQAGPVTVRVLDTEQSFAPTEAALAFSQQRMFGGEVKRSRDMLQPVKVGKKHIYLPAADFGKVKA